MSIITILYSLLIKPLELFFEFVYTICARVTGSAGLSIIALSLIMNILVLPLYKRADEMQAEERDTSLKLKKGIDHIKKTFSGDERFMMLQTFYRQNHYSPFSALKGSISLLLEIPFFIAAYRFLSNLESLKGVGFGPISDLGSPDSIIKIGAIAINILPILMTLINVISAAIYSKGFPLKTKIQLYGMAGIFLVFLYQSPAGLVFYWTLNNVFSLVKNIFYKLKHANLILSIGTSLVGILLVVFVFVRRIRLTPARLMAVLLVAIIFQLPIIYHFIKDKGFVKKIRNKQFNGKDYFIWGGIFCAVLVGLLIPSSVIQSSPAEFVNLKAYYNPLWYVLNSTCLAIGFFVIWLGIFYALMNKSMKNIFGYVIWAIGGIFIANYMGFGRHLGRLSAQLKFEVSPVYGRAEQLLNIAVILVIGIVFLIIYLKKNNLVPIVYGAGIIAMIVMSVLNISSISSDLKTIRSLDISDEQATIPLSKTGKNVIVLMLDRALNGEVPYIVNEIPALKEGLSGFTLYRNSVSFGNATNVGSPGIYGGYEYTPYEMNMRKDESLKDKHNEALKVMPVLFDKAGYEVTVCDPTYANYLWIPDLSIYDEYPNINKYITRGSFNTDSKETVKKYDHIWTRNFFCYGIFKVSPVILQNAMYNNGMYNEAQYANTLVWGVDQVFYGLHESSGINTTFMDTYLVLENLINMTEIVNEEKGTFMMMSNDATHEPAMLQTPNYVPSEKVDNTEYDKAHAKDYILNGVEMDMSDAKQVTSYHVNAATLLRLSEWFDYMKANDVYDNTRIILVSDHGMDVGQFKGDEFFDSFDLETYNCLMMVKDFDADGFTIDEDTFMTNADTPTIAFEGLIDKPINPSTGKEINNNYKDEKDELYIHYVKDFNVDTNNGNAFANSGRWFSVKDNIFIEDNWKEISNPTLE